MLQSSSNRQRIAHMVSFLFMVRFNFMHLKIGTKFILRSKSSVSVEVNHFWNNFASQGFPEAGRGGFSLKGYLSVYCTCLHGQSGSVIIGKCTSTYTVSSNVGAHQPSYLRDERRKLHWRGDSEQLCSKQASRRRRKKNVIKKRRTAFHQARCGTVVSLW